jgi:hypothetical protein
MATQDMSSMSRRVEKIDDALATTDALASEAAVFIDLAAECMPFFNSLLRRHAVAMEYVEPGNGPAWGQSSQVACARDL